jgi:tRNA dimethylallyltransferase
MAQRLPDDVLDGLEGLDALLIAGPTASGKSALAIGAAVVFGGVVVNADSMQIYDGVRILTARPTPAEEAQVEHRLYGCIDPRTAFSAGDYVRALRPVLAELRARRRLAVVVGGTGLYFRAITQGLVATPEIPPHVMDEVEALGAGPGLHAWLGARDPARAAELNPADAPRLQRAAAIWLATGRPTAFWRAQEQPPLLEAGRWRGVVLTPDRSALYERIDRRFGSMIEAGALDEARRIMALGLPANRGVMKAHGMPHLVRHLEGAMTLDEAVERGRRDTRNYARRQGVWARRYMADWRQLPAS